jgi:Flp pilus assembly protein TadB
MEFQKAVEDLKERVTEEELCTQQVKAQTSQLQKEGSDVSESVQRLQTTVKATKGLRVSLRRCYLFIDS